MMKSALRPLRDTTKQRAEKYAADPDYLTLTDAK